METTRFSSIDAKSIQYWILLGALGLAALVGYLASHHMDMEGHHISGMTNQIVWGFPHVMAIFLIVAASGALNVASISSVFGKIDYKPLARLSALLAIALLIGGLIILVLDLGRPDRLIVAMTIYNFKSIFAWNIFSIYRLHYHHRNLFMDDDGTQDEQIQQDCRIVCLSMETDTNYWYRFHLWIPGSTSSL